MLLFLLLLLLLFFFVHFLGVNDIFSLLPLLLLLFLFLLLLLYSSVIRHDGSLFYPIWARLLDWKSYETGVIRNLLFLICPMYPSMVCCVYRGGQPPWPPTAQMIKCRIAHSRGPSPGVRMMLNGKIVGIWLAITRTGRKSPPFLIIRFIERFMWLLIF